MTEDESTEHEAEGASESTTSQEELDEILDEAKARFKYGMSRSHDWRNEAKTCYDFVSGKQWDDVDRSKLEEEGRPCVTFNRVEPLIDAVSGLEITNRQEVRYIPREKGDVGVNEVLTSAAKWARDSNDTEDEESEAFVDTLISGMGWTETRMDYAEDPEGQIAIDRIDPLMMVWDPNSTKQNLKDARWVMYVKDLDKEEFDVLFPGNEDINGSGPWDSEDFGREEGAIHDADEAPLYKNDQGGLNEDTGFVRVVQYQRKVRQKYWTIKDPQSGQFLSIADDRWAAMQQYLKNISIPVSEAVPRMGWRYQQIILAGNKVLKVKPNPCDYSFTFKCITAKRDRNTKTWYGIVRAMIDPTKWSNKLFSELLGTIQSGSKGGLMVETSAATNMRKLEEAWADPRKVVELNDGAIRNGAIKERQPSTYPQGMDRLMQFAVVSIPNVTGIPIELLGLTDKVQAGIVEAQRKQAGLAILARVFNSLRRYRKEQGRVLLHFIQKYISDGRLVRVVGEDGAKYVPLTKDESLRQYDIVVDDAPNSPNMRERVWAILQETLPYLVKMGFPVPPEVVEYMPLPESLTTKWMEMMSPPKDPQAIAEAQRKKDQQDRAIEAEIDEKESKSSLNYAKTLEAVGAVPDSATGEIAKGKSLN